MIVVLFNSQIARKRCDCKNGYKIKVFMAKKVMHSDSVLLTLSSVIMNLNTFLVSFFLNFNTLVRSH